MKVLYFHQHFSTPKGAVGIRSYEMAKTLLARGHKVVMVCGSYGGGETGLVVPFSNGLRRGFVDGIEIVEFNLKYSNSDGFLKRTLTFLKFAARSVWIAFSEEYDVVFATTTPLTAGIPGIFARWFRGKRFVFEVRDLWPELPKAMGVIRNPIILWLMSLLELVSYRSAHKLIGLSPGIVEGIARRGVEKDKIIFVPNGCDLDIFADARDSWRPAEVADDDFLAVFAGTHGIANGLTAILDAAEELSRRGRNDIKILLIGQGKLKPTLQQSAKDRRLTNVIFHEPVNKVKLSGLFASCNLGLQVLANVPAFYYGTSPNKFFDYISAGLPVLNNYPGWLAEVIVKNNCGYAVAPDDAVAFADALVEAADNRDMLIEKGVNARLLAKRDFDRGKLSEKWAHWIESASK